MLLREKRQQFDFLKLFRKSQKISQTNLQAIIHSLGVGIIVVDQNEKIIMMNMVAEELTGWDKQAAVGLFCQEVLKLFDLQGKKISFSFMIKKIDDDEPKELMMSSKNGDSFIIEKIMTSVVTSEGKTIGTAFVFRNATEQKKRLMEIEQLSYCDYLTKLYNRRYMEEKLAELDAEINYPLGIMFLDVNGLKQINDTFGHDSGDELLRKLAEILRDVCALRGFICRIGGDEFAVIIVKTSKAELANIKKNLLQRAKKEKVHSFDISLAIGFAIKRTPEQSIRQIKIAADQLMFEDKKKFKRSSWRKLDKGYNDGQNSVNY